MTIRTPLLTLNSCFKSFLEVEEEVTTSSESSLGVMDSPGLLISIALFSNILCLPKTVCIFVKSN